MAYPTITDLAESTYEALAGTTLTGANIKSPAKGVSPQSSPSLLAQLNRMLYIIAQNDEHDCDGKVYNCNSGLAVGVNPCVYKDSGGTARSYAGVATTNVTDNATNYIYLVGTTAVLTMSTSSFPATESTYLPLAIVVASSGAITSVTDYRNYARLRIQPSSSSVTGTDGTSFTVDQDNTGAGTDTSIYFNRGTDGSSEDAEIEWDETNDRFNVRSQHSTATMANVNVLAIYISGTSMLDTNGAAKVQSAVAGDGLAHTSGVLSVSTDGSTMETSSDAIRVKDGGVTATKLSDAVADKLAQLTLTSPSGSSPQTVTLQVKDLQGNNLSESCYVGVGVYQDDGGAANATNATIAIGATGSLVRSITATKVLVILTNSSGTATLAVTDGTLETVYVIGHPDRRSKILDCSAIGTVVIS